MSRELILTCSALNSQFRFGVSGGTFGRSQKCDWVLPDPNRILSSIHARIVHQAGTFLVIDESTNGTFVAGQSEPIGRGQSVPLSNGTVIVAGPYEIAAQIVAGQPQVQQPAGAAPQPQPGISAQQPAQPVQPMQQAPQQPAAQAGYPPASAFSPDNQFLAPGQTSGAPTKKKQSLDPLDYLGGGQPSQAPVAGTPLPQEIIPQDPTPFVSAPAVTQVMPQQTTVQVQPSPVEAAPAAVPAQPAPQTQPVADPTQPVAPAASSVSPVSPQAPSAPSAAPTPPQQAGIPDDFWNSLPGGPAGALGQAGSQGGAAGQPQTGRPVAQQGQTPGQAGAVPAGQSAIPDTFDLGLGAGAAAPSAQPATAPVQPASQAPGPMPPAPQQPASPAAAVGMPMAAGSIPVPRPGTAGGLSHLEALKSRRDQRVAALNAKAQGADKDEARLAGGPAQSPPLPAAAGTAAPVSSPYTTAQAPASSPAHAAAETGPTPQPAPPTSTPAAKQPARIPASAAITPKSTTPSGGEGDAEDQVRALLKGLGFPNADASEADVNRLMEDVGGMVREMSVGLVALMEARKMVKSEFRMDETRIEPKENNPFKYFKVSELLLDEMLLTRTEGFLPPQQATRNAFQDLQSHTMITMSAMQRAMRLLFERLSPEALTDTADGDGALTLRNFGGRRDKWDTARKNYELMRKEFESVMRQTISEAFVQVQEEQARRMSKDYWNKRKK